MSTNRKNKLVRAFKRNGKVVIIDMPIVKTQKLTKVLNEWDLKSPKGETE